MWPPGPGKASESAPRSDGSSNLAHGPSLIPARGLDVDDIDRMLLRHLREDARLSMAELGRQVGLSRTATLARVRALEASGTIRGYHADVRPSAAEASHAARIGVVVRTPDVAAYVRRLRAFPELEEAEAVAGEYDLLVRVSAASAARLDEILDRIGGWRETVRTTTFVVLKRYTA